MSVSDREYDETTEELAAAIRRARELEGALAAVHAVKHAWIDGDLTDDAFGEYLSAVLATAPEVRLLNDGEQALHLLRTAVFAEIDRIESGSIDLPGISRRLRAALEGSTE